MKGGLSLPRAAAVWGTDRFAHALKNELESLPGAVLPLQAGLAETSYALEEGFSVMVLGAVERAGRIQARVGVFYQGITPGCACADDPTPVEPRPEYCECIVEIDPRSARASIRLCTERG